MPLHARSPLLVHKRAAALARLDARVTTARKKRGKLVVSVPSGAAHLLYLISPCSHPMRPPTRRDRRNKYDARPGPGGLPGVVLQYTAAAARDDPESGGRAGQRALPRPHPLLQPCS